MLAFYRDPTMQKFTTYIILLVILGGGLLSLYRFALSSKDFTKIEAKVLDKKLETISTHKGSNRFGVTFKVDISDIKYGVYAGTKNPALDNNLLKQIDTGKIYSFLIDPTVSTDNGINLGIREIDFNGKNIYRESQKFNLFLSVLFTILGAGGLFIINKFKRTKNAS